MLCKERWWRWRQHLYNAENPLTEWIVRETDTLIVNVHRVKDARKKRERIEYTYGSLYVSRMSTRNLSADITERENRNMREQNSWQFDKGYLFTLKQLIRFLSTLSSAQMSSLIKARIQHYFHHFRVKFNVCYNEKLERKDYKFICGSITLNTRWRVIREQILIGKNNVPATDTTNIVILQLRNMNTKCGRKVKV